MAAAAIVRKVLLLEMTCLISPPKLPLTRICLLCSTLLQCLYKTWGEIYIGACIIHSTACICKNSVEDKECKMQSGCGSEKIRV
jgi:hypothetical protein